MAKSECSGCMVMEKYERKRRHRCGTVFGYLLKQMGPNNEWMTLVYKRSNKVHRGKNALATPGGSVRREDLNHWQFSPHSHPCFCKQKLVMVVNRAEAACVSFSTTLYCNFFFWTSTRRIPAHKCQQHWFESVSRASCASRPSPPLSCVKFIEQMSAGFLRLLFNHTVQK